MPMFTTRVELHGADYNDYERLHVEMRREGFTTTITGDNGVTYHLPPAEYDFRGEFTGAQVLDKAQSAATRVAKPHAVLVTEMTTRIWRGLPVVNQRRAG